VADPAEAAAMMTRLRTTPPAELAGFPVHVTTQADAVFLIGGDKQTSVRVVVRPSGTEPKVKCYTEVRQGVGTDLADARRHAAAVQEGLLESVRNW
jgi:phosphomannomutase